MKDKKTNLILWWIFLTIIYSISLGLGGGYITAISGLFVPIGPLVVFGFFMNPVMCIFSVILVLFVVIRFNMIINKWDATTSKKIFTILLILFILTIIADFLIYGMWMSLGYLGNGGDYSF